MDPTIGSFIGVWRSIRVLRATRRLRHDHSNGFEEAAVDAADGDRHFVAFTLSKVALNTSTPAGAMAINRLGSVGRVAELLAPAPPPHRRCYAASYGWRSPPPPSSPGSNSTTSSACSSTLPVLRSLPTTAPFRRAKAVVAQQTLFTDGYELTATPPPG